MKTVDLPLVADRAYVGGAGGVSFDALIDGSRVPCYVSRAALETYFGANADAAADDAAPCLSAFDKHARLIHQLASRIWRRNGTESPAVVLTVEGVFRALTQR